MRPHLSISRRTSRTPFSSRVEAAGATGYTVYNHTLLATSFRGTADDEPRRTDAKYARASSASMKQKLESYQRRGGEHAEGRMCHWCEEKKGRGASPPDVT